MPDAGQKEVDDLLVRQWRGDTLHTVYQLDDGRVTKRYWIRPGVTRFKRPWRREHAALVRLASARFGNSYGYTERPHSGGWEAALTRDPVNATGTVTLQPDDVPALAALLTSVHASAVLVGDMPLSGLCRHVEGGLVFSEFGDATLCPAVTPGFSFQAGREVARFARTFLGRDPGASDVLRRAYLARCEAGGVRRIALRTGMRFTGRVRGTVPASAQP